jgi:hypothetical protein
VPREADTVPEPSTPALLSGVVADVLTLVRHELALARREMLDELAKLKAATMAIAMAGAIVGVGGGVLVLAAAGGLADWFDWPTWAGQAAVGGALVLVGIIVLSSAKGRLRGITPVPVNAVKSVKEDVAWLRQRTVAREGTTK